MVQPSRSNSQAPKGRIRKVSWGHNLLGPSICSWAIMIPWGASPSALPTAHLRIEWIHQTWHQKLIMGTGPPCWHRIQREKEANVITRGCRCSERWDSDLSCFHIQWHPWSHLPSLPPFLPSFPHSSFPSSLPLSLPPILLPFLPSTNTCWQPAPKQVGSWGVCLTKENGPLPSISDSQPGGGGAEKVRHVGKLQNIISRSETWEHGVDGIFLCPEAYWSWCLTTDAVWAEF